MEFSLLSSPSGVSKFKRLTMADPNEYVLTLTPNDVLFGRGSGPNDHEGNIRFRDLVAQRKNEYMATNHRQTKAKIAKSIVDAVLESQGRFLKKLEPSEIEKLGYPEGVDVYTIVDDATIMEKAKQALRQNRDKNHSNAVVSGNTNNNDAMVALDNVQQGMGVGMGIGFQGNEFGMDPNMMNPNPIQGLPISPQIQQQLYRENADGYATYTTSLDDPEDDSLFPGAGRGSERSKLGTFKKGDSMNMSQLMESVKGMSTTGMNSSSDTIGTIEGNMMLGASGVSNMSVVSMSSNSELFKSDEEKDTVGKGPMPNPDIQQQFHPSMPPPGNSSRGSMMSRDGWTSTNINNLMQGPLEGSSAMLDASGALASTSTPRNLQLMEDQPDSLGYLGSSSLSILRAAGNNFDSGRSTDERILPP